MFAILKDKVINSFLLLLLMWLQEFYLVERVGPGLKLIAREAGLPRDRDVPRQGCQMKMSG
jgi:hypothetical protein